VGLTAGRFHDTVDEYVFSSLFTEAVDELGKRHTDQPYVHTSQIRDWLNHRLQEHKASRNELNGLHGHFVPHPHYSGDEPSSGRVLAPEADEFADQRTKCYPVGPSPPEAAADIPGAEFFTAYTSVFVGRQKERDRIRSLVNSGGRGYLFVRGIGGSGKS